MSGHSRVGSSSGSEFNPVDPLQQQKADQKLKKGGKVGVGKVGVNDLIRGLRGKIADSPTKSSSTDRLPTKKSNLREKTDLESKNAIIKQKINTLSNTLMNKNVDLIHTKATIFQNTGQITALQTSIKNASSFFGRLKNRFSSIRVEVKKLKMEVEAKIQSIKTLNEKAASLQEDINKCESDIKTAEEDLKIIPAEHAQAMAEIHSLGSEIATIKKDIYLVDTAQKKHAEISGKISVVMPSVEKMEINTSGKNEREAFHLRATKLLEMVSGGTKELHAMHKDYSSKILYLNREHHVNKSMLTKGAPMTTKILAIKKQMKDLEESFTKVISNTTDHPSGISPEITALKEVYFALHPEADTFSLELLDRVHGELREVLDLHLQ